MAGNTDTKEQEKGGTLGGSTPKWYLLAGGVVLAVFAVWYFFFRTDEVSEQMKRVREAKAMKAALKNTPAEDESIPEN